MTTLTNTKREEYAKHMADLLERNETDSFLCPNEQCHEIALETIYSHAKTSAIMAIADWTDLEISMLHLLIERGIQPVVIARDFVVGDKPAAIVEYEASGKVLVKRPQSLEKELEIFGEIEASNYGRVTMLIVDDRRYIISARPRGLPRTVINRRITFYTTRVEQLSKDLSFL